MFTIENEFLSVKIRALGAELSSIYSKKTALEYLWDGNPEFWAKQSPVLFPIVGTLKHSKYIVKGLTYELGRHGFAREMEFTVTQHDSRLIRFTLTDTPETLKKYPFRFTLNIVYTLDAGKLNVSYEVINEGLEEMLFSIGGHPAFKLPLEEGLHYNDYLLEFNMEEDAARWMISEDGLLSNQSSPVLRNTKILPLSKSLFYEDALVFKHLSSSQVKIKSSVSAHGLVFDFTGFPYLGIWAGKDADFICIEPWCGIADNIESDQQLQHKEGIQTLGMGETFNRTWCITPF